MRRKAPLPLDPRDTKESDKILLFKRKRKEKKKFLHSFLRCNRKEKKKFLHSFLRCNPPSTTHSAVPSSLIKNPKQERNNLF